MALRVLTLVEAVMREPTAGIGQPRLYASLPVAMNSSLAAPALNESSSANSHSA